MAYCASADVTARIPTLNLAQLTNDTANATTADTTVLNALIAAADAEIDAILSDRFTVPFTSVPGRIRDISATITIFHAQARRFGVMNVAKDWRDQYTAALKELQAFVTGEHILVGATIKAFNESAIVAPDREVNFDDTDNQASYF
jgi:phage gp36-like protein